MKGNYQNLLEDYQSIYTGEQIDDRLTKAGTAVQGVTIDGVLQPKDANNNVNLPAVVTPEDVDAKVAAETQRATAKESELQDAINTKQPIIADLDTIRQGAAKGATAVQPAAIADMETRTHASSTYATKTEVNTGLAAKQDVIADLATIRQGAAKGATAVQRTELLNYYTKEQIEATYATKLALNEKIERVELWYNQPANSICLLGSTTPLSYSQIAAYVDDKKKFVTLLDIDGEYLLPQWNDGGALIFTGLNVLSYGTWAHRIAINIDDDIKAEYYEVQQKLIPGANISIEDNVISAIGGGSGIPDAPTDGKLYGRKNGAWNEGASKSELDTLSLKVGKFAEVTEQSATPTFTINATNYERNTIVHCGVLSSLTIASITAIPMEVNIHFQTGESVDNFLDIPADAKHIGEVTCEASSEYVMSILDGVIILGKVE